MTTVELLTILGLVTIQILFYKIRTRDVVRRAAVIFGFYVIFFTIREFALAGLNYFGFGFFDLPLIVTVSFLVAKLVSAKSPIRSTTYGAPNFYFLSALWLTALQIPMAGNFSFWRFLSVAAAAVVLLAVFSAARERLELSNLPDEKLFLPMFFMFAAIFSLAFTAF